MYNKFYKIIVNVILTIAFLITFYGCKTPQETKLQRYEFGEPYMGTWWRIVLYAPNKELAETAVKAAFKRIAELDNKFSDYYAETELMQLCYKSGKGEVKVSEDLYDIIEKSISIAKKTDGAFDITTGPCVQLWRWSGRHNQFPPDEKFKAALKLVGYENVKLNRKNQTIVLLKEGMRLDLGGIAKGYCADIALNILREYGITKALVAASGDIAIGDPPPDKQGWIIDIGTGENKTNTFGLKLCLKNVGISTSGDVEQFIQINGIRYAHILNPKTGLGLTNRIQVTVLSYNASISDPLATAACVLGLEKGLKMIESYRKTSALFIIQNGTNRIIKASSRFPIKDLN